MFRAMDDSPAYDGSPSLLEDNDSSASTSLLSFSADTTANSNTTKESEADANSDTHESEADDSSVSSLSTSESIWEKGYHLPKEEAVSILSKVASSLIT